MFSTALAWLLPWEGGFVNHPDDPGGKTNKGITQKTFDSYRNEKQLPLKSVKHITKKEAEAIYLEKYWKPFDTWGLNARQHWAVFNIAVNAGVGKARDLVSRTNRVYNHRSQPELWLERFVHETEQHYHRISNANASLRQFLPGWLNRTNSLKKALGFKPNKSLLKKGDHGPAVVHMQKQLNSKAYYISVDGVFGPLTESAVKEFQRAHGLTVDGIVGPQTWKLLA